MQPSKLPVTLAISDQGQESIEAFNQAVDKLEAHTAEVDRLTQEVIEAANGTIPDSIYKIIETARSNIRQARINLAVYKLGLTRQRSELLHDLEAEAAAEAEQITSSMPDLYQAVRDRLTAENPNMYGHLSEPRMSVEVGRSTQMQQAKVRADTCNAIILQCQRESGNGTLASAEADFQDFLKRMIET